MDWNITQNFSSNIVFGILLFAMITYWINLSLFRGNKNLIKIGKWGAIIANRDWVTSSPPTAGLLGLFG